MDSDLDSHSDTSDNRGDDLDPWRDERNRFDALASPRDSAPYMRSPSQPDYNQQSISDLNSRFLSASPIQYSKQRDLVEELREQKELDEEDTKKRTILNQALILLIAFGLSYFNRWR